MGRLFLLIFSLPVLGIGYQANNEIEITKKNEPIAALLRLAFYFPLG